MPLSPEKAAPQWRRWPESRAAAPAELADVERRLLGQALDEHGQPLPEQATWTEADQADANGFRWRHAALAQELAAGGDIEAALTTALASENRVVAATAQTGLGRLAPGRHGEALAAVVDDRLLPESVRRAAIETLAAHDDAASTTLLDRLHAKYADPSAGGPADVLYHPGLHVELLRATAARAESLPQDERFLASLASPDEAVQFAAIRLLAEQDAAPLPTAAIDLLSPDHSPPVRLAVLRLLAEPARGPLPEVAVALLRDPEPPIRNAAIDAAIAHGHPAALDVVEQMTMQFDVSTQRRAIAWLGRIDDPRAAQTLRRLLDDPKDFVRTAAVSALAEQGDVEAMQTAVEDEQWRVRRAVTAAVADMPAAAAGEIAARLVHDDAVEVQLALVEAIGNWPLERSGPLLLEALDGPSGRVRQAAATRLGQAWPDAVDFPVAADAQRRSGALAALRQQWESQFGPLAPQVEAAPAAESVTSLTPALRAEVARLLAGEMDTTTWQATLTRLENASAEAVQPVAVAALSHESALVRRLGCERLHGELDEQQLAALAPLLDDEEPLVRIAAVDAFGRAGQPRHAASLKRLMASSDKRLQLATAAALTRLESPSGPAALRRLMLDADPAVRRAVAEQMGQLRQGEFVGSLLTLLDDVAAVRDAALKALPQAAGPTITRQVLDAVPNDPVLQAQRWRDWNQRNGAATP